MRNRTPREQLQIDLESLASTLDGCERFLTDEELVKAQDWVSQLETIADACEERQREWDENECPDCGEQMESGVCLACVQEEEDSDDEEG